MEAHQLAHDPAQHSAVETVVPGNTVRHLGYNGAWRRAFVRGPEGLVDPGAEEEVRMHAGTRHFGFRCRG
jgi:hypothetical protein